MTHLFSYVLIGLVGLFSMIFDPAYAEGSSDDSSEASSPLFGAAEDAIEKQDYAAAVPLLQQVTSAEPMNADAWNLLGFSNRKLGNMEAAAAAYAKALQINPGHLGALEYQGEMFVQMGQLGNAMLNLTTLESLCGSCEEATDLKEAIDAGKS
jgi:cytochrome c-type biogenesis protein CcmH/NrfG